MYDYEGSYVPWLNKFPVVIFWTIDLSMRIILLTRDISLFFYVVSIIPG